jgi:hypothetical protein
MNSLVQAFLGPQEQLGQQAFPDLQEQPAQQVQSDQQAFPDLQQ